MMPGRPKGWHTTFIRGKMTRFRLPGDIAERGTRYACTFTPNELVFIPSPDGACVLGGEGSRYLGLSVNADVTGWGNGVIYQVDKEGEKIVIRRMRVLSGT